MDSSYLNVEFIRNSFEFFHILSQLGQSDVHWRSQSCTQISRARRYVAQVLVMGKLGHFLNMRTGLGQSCEYFPNICTGLHRDNPQLVFFIYPHQECLTLIVEDAPVGRPFPIETTRFQESVPLLKQEMVLN